MSSSGGKSNSLTTYSGVLASDTAVANSATVLLMTTPSLAVGTYLATYAVTYIATTAVPDDCEFELIVGTATATFAGPRNFSLANGASNPASGSVSFIVTVTVAGTLIVNAVAGAAGGGTAKAVSGLTGLPGSGYTLVKIA